MHDVRVAGVLGVGSQTDIAHDPVLSTEASRDMPGDPDANMQAKRKPTMVQTKIKLQRLSPNR